MQNNTHWIWQHMLCSPWPFFGRRRRRLLSEVVKIHGSMITSTALQQQSLLVPAIATQDDSRQLLRAIQDEPKPDFEGLSSCNSALMTMRLCSSWRMPIATYQYVSRGSKAQPTDQQILGPKKKMFESLHQRLFKTKVVPRHQKETHYSNMSSQDSEA